MKKENPWWKDAIEVYGGIALAFAIFGPMVLLPQKEATIWWQFLIVIVGIMIIVMTIKESRKTKKHHSHDATPT